jgi:hypothetical protein
MQGNLNAAQKEFKTRRFDQENKMESMKSALAFPTRAAPHKIQQCKYEIEKSGGRSYLFADDPRQFADPIFNFQELEDLS